MVYHPELSDRLQKLFEDAMTHGTDIIDRGEQLIPFLFTTGSSGGKITVFVNDSDDMASQGIYDAKLQISDSKQEIDAYVLGYDALLPLADSSQIDALILEGSERGISFGFIFARCYYQREEDGEIVFIIDGNGFLQKSEQLLTT
ncbi:hypothetical protein [Chamaesiphon polymorphus]|uniref:Uncharacterized protein n=1 Tax=Chamaesiphon polymorphus CCALA 037 TaxID=2107692 RepID=A0A2T1GDC8_9CYAN|nr:hypothetical protein [Chamaesiphon polymorphus]PSB55491.1 hypothetical protein C7B77_14810 [Chamaesiphon polymorphus CCALA 037]